MIAPAVFQMLLIVTGWLERREQALAYLMEENRLLRRQLGGRRLGLTDDERRRLAVRAFRVGRLALRFVRSTIARILKTHGMPPVPERPSSWHTFLRAH